MSMRRLIEEGSDIHALTNENKSPFQLAEEMKCSLVFERALQDSGRYHEDGTPRMKPRLTNDLAKKVVFISPFVWSSPVSLTIVCHLDCDGSVVGVTFLFVVVDDSRLACWLEYPHSEVYYERFTRHARPNSQDAILGRNICFLSSTRFAKMDIHDS